MHLPKTANLQNFNPRLREGGDDIYHAPSCCKKISIHASAKEATAIIFVFFGGVTDFNPRLREGGDDVQILKNPKYSDFNPRLREGGDALHCVPTVLIVTISIHASAKEATKFKVVFKPDVWISIHASAKEATTKTVVYTKGKYISIHASAKEATTGISLNLES